MDQLQAQANQEKAANDSTNEQKKLAYAFATTQIASLTSQLDAQTKDLQATDQTVPASQIPKFYATSVPKDPIPSTSGKSAPILGAVLGMFCGWLVTNRRWLAGGTNMARENVNEEENETSWQGSTASITPERMAEPENDDWLNQGIYKPQEVPKKEDDDWLNVGINKSPEGTDKKENDGLVTSGITQRSEDRNNKDEKEKNDDWLNRGINTLGNNGKKENTNDWFAGDLDITPEGTKPKEDNER
jgi:hypothetical protein